MRQPKLHLKSTFLYYGGFCHFLPLVEKTIRDGWVVWVMLGFRFIST
ncbi:hypothetical protein H5968_15695 [Sphaerospermopsis sp. LEGE 00249]|nr:hypothetical protein [Sphaerospermopsis sp. LEGE 00249]MBC5796551.1 hypothetical protein [Sphaerospermopsis sp. LEGE 00249]